MEGLRERRVVVWRRAGGQVVMVEGEGVGAGGAGGVAVGWGGGSWG